MTVRTIVHMPGNGTRYAIVTGRIFNIPGIGGYTSRSVRSRDGAAVVGAVTVLVIVYLFVNLLVDLLYGLLDPRISHD